MPSGFGESPGRGEPLKPTVFFAGGLDDMGGDDGVPSSARRSLSTSRKSMPLDSDRPPSAALVSSARSCVELLADPAVPGRGPTM